ncbi:MAG: hypothetical protein ACI9K2_007502 [Myxococcota bacterium]|jgi:hypothetical protein
MFRLALGLVALLALPAHAGPQKRAAKAMGVELDGTRPLAGALAKAGWIATPEGSDRYQPGNIYTETHALWSARAGCFDGEPLESIYNELEVIQALQAGARVPLGVVTASVEGMRYKRLTYADPMVTELEGRSLKLTENCGRDLAAEAAGADVSSWYVVQAVLLAVVNEQECTELEASARTLVGGGGGSVSEECSRGSVGQVAVAYKVQPVSEVLGGAVAPPAATTPQPSGPRGAVSGSGGFDGTLDVSADLAEQACVREAERLGAAERDARLARAQAALQKEARDAWGKLEPQAEACLQLDDRAACVATVERFIAWAGGLQVQVEAGYERVATDCGERSAALAAASRSVKVEEMVKAKATLGQIKSAPAVTATNVAHFGPPPIASAPAVTDEGARASRGWSRPVAWLGGAMLGVGAGLAGGTYGVASSRAQPRERDGGLIAVNTVGWGVAIAGGGALGVGLLARGGR